MCGFLLKMWQIGKLDTAKVRAYAPRYITAEQAEEILRTPQQTGS